MDYQDINAKTIDRWVNEGWEWGKPLDHETYERATKGDWQVLATPTKAVPQEEGGFCYSPYDPSTSVNPVNTA